MPEFDPKKIYLRATTDSNGQPRLVDQDGRFVASVRTIDLRVGYDCVGEYTLTGLLHDANNQVFIGGSKPDA